MAKEKQKPLTREDVLKEIRKHGRRAEGFNLSGKEFEDGIDLSNLNLRGIILNKAVLSSANFNGSNLSDAKFIGAKLERAKFNECKDKPFPAFANLRGADFSGADLTEAEFIGAFLNSTKFKDADLTEADLSIKGRRQPDLHFTDFRGADLSFADFTGRTFHFTKLEGAYLSWAKITEEDVYLGDADWGNYKIGEEIKYKNYYSAERRYRQLKMWYTDSGYYDTAGEFFFREMEAKRKGVKWWPKFWHRGWLGFVAFICGYGERPLRVIGWAVSVVLGSALIYFIIGSVWKWWAFWNSLYFSAVSFTALGYGSWVETTNDWIRGIGAFESFIGVFTIALFLITFTRKMRR